MTKSRIGFARRIFDIRYSLFAIRNSLFDIRYSPSLAFAAIFASGVLAILLTARVYYDDPYITFRYAWNLAHGRGFVYNVGERVAGTTAPLYALALAGFFAVGAPLGLAVGSLNALGYALIGWASWRIFRRMEMPWGGATLGLLLLIEPELYVLYGHETVLVLGALLSAFALYDSGRHTAAFVAAALATALRPDLGLVGVILILVSLEEDRRRLWPGLAWAAAVFLPLYLAFVLYYHAPAPNTLAAKMAQGARNFAPFWKGTLHGVRRALFGPDFFPCGALVFLGGALMFMRRWLALPLFVILYAVAYCVINPPYTYNWYHAPFWLLRACAIAWGIGWLAERRSAGSLAWNRRGRHAAAAALLIVSAFWTVWRHRDPYLYLYGRWVCWNATAQRLKELDPSDRRLVINEIGIVGYQLMDWKIIDIEGLVHRAPMGELIGDDPPKYLCVYGPSSSYWLRAGEIGHRYKLIQDFRAPDYRTGLFELSESPSER